MLRKLTALFLILLMTVASATSQAGLRYCFCLETVFVGDCECAELFSTGDSTGASAESSDACDCSGCAQNEKTVAEISSCNDCSVDVPPQPDDFASARGEQIPSKSFPLFLGFISPSNTADFTAPARRISVHETRGSPTPFIAATAVPLFIRHSVFLV